jgi:hypothetical protein
MHHIFLSPKGFLKPTSVKSLQPEYFFFLPLSQQTHHSSPPPPFSDSNTNPFGSYSCGIFCKKNSLEWTLRCFSLKATAPDQPPSPAAISASSASAIAAAAKSSHDKTIRVGVGVSVGVGGALAIAIVAIGFIRARRRATQRKESEQKRSARAGSENTNHVGMEQASDQQWTTVGN